MNQFALPRNLRGVNGARLISMPGVHHRPEVLAEGEPAAPKKRACTQPPAWGMSSREAAALLHCSESAARIALHKKCVKHLLVRKSGEPVRLFWDRKQVEKLAATRAPILEQVPGKLVDSQTAADMLQVGRSSLFRYAGKGWLHPCRTRVQTESGLRIHVYYRRDEVSKLQRFLRARRKAMSDVNQLRADFEREEVRGEQGT